MEEREDLTLKIRVQFPALFPSSGGNLVARASLWKRVIGGSSPPLPTIYQYSSMVELPPDERVIFVQLKVLVPSLHSIMALLGRCIP